jgi:site-specific DNA-methyltransferase (adenine-specific)
MGLGLMGKSKARKRINNSKKQIIRNIVLKDWDKEIPKAEYFAELERVSKNQIIWGGKLFTEHLTKATKGWIVWDKKGQEGLTMSD